MPSESAKPQSPQDDDHMETSVAVTGDSVSGGGDECASGDGDEFASGGGDERASGGGTDSEESVSGLIQPAEKEDLFNYIKGFSSKKFQDFIKPGETKLELKDIPNQDLHQQQK